MPVLETEHYEKAMPQWRCRDGAGGKVATITNHDNFGGLKKTQMYYLPVLEIRKPNASKTKVSTELHSVCRVCFLAFPPQCVVLSHPFSRLRGRHSLTLHVLSHSVASDSLQPHGL